MVFCENYPLSWFIFHFYVGSLGVISSIEETIHQKQLNIQNLLRGWKKTRALQQVFQSIFRVVFKVDSPIEFPIDFPMIFLHVPYKVVPPQLCLLVYNPHEL